MSQPKIADVIVIGCGIVGAATAFELSKLNVSTIVLEKENDVSMGTTKANSAILHAGYDPEPGSLMAKLNVKGVKLAEEICGKLNVAYKKCGSLVLSFTQDDEKTLKKLYERGVQNGVEGLQLWGREELQKNEANISPAALGALYAPSAAIVDPWGFALALIQTAVKNGVELCLNQAVESITKHGAYYTVHTNGGEYSAKFVVNAAGVNAGEIHEMVAPKSFDTIISKGEYFLLDKSEGATVSHVVFQCPNEHGKGVLVAPTVHGNLIVGPSSVQNDDKTCVACTANGLHDVAAAAKKTAPSLNLAQCIRNFAGNRAKTNVDDFIIEEVNGARGFIDLAGIQSPGLSAAPAIAEMAVELLKNAGLDAKSKENFVLERDKIVFNNLSTEEKKKLIAKNPDYGKVVCRCETVTLGEIMHALNSEVPPHSIDGVKRRTNAGMGRCQGGFCSPTVLAILAEHYGVSPLEICQDGANSFVLVSETKMNGGDEK